MPEAHYHEIDGVLTYALGHTVNCDRCNPPSDAVRAPISETEIMGDVFTPVVIPAPKRSHHKQRVLSNVPVVE